MAMIRYYCNHCSHAFEAEEREHMECPTCVWTSSVVREADHRESEIHLQEAASKKKTSAVPAGLRIAFDAIKPLLILLILIGVGAAGFIFFKPQAESLGTKVKSHAVNLKRPPLDIQGNLLTKKKSSKSPVPLEGQDLAAASTPPVLSEQEKTVLARKIELDAARQLSTMEKELLGRPAFLKTGRVEKLPGPVWNLELFKQMLAEQQAAYQVPLPRSYRTKLHELFEAKYLAGAQAFTEGRLLEARNLWVESLGFPIYSNDIEKHRGVVLTMLRSFINDTLSKIGALNSMLVEGPVRDLETKLNGVHGEFQALVNQQNWEAAFEAAQRLLVMVDDFEKTAARRPQVPAYAPTMQIDRDIGKSLYDLLETSRPAVADIGALERDVRMKKQVLETLLPGRFSEFTGYYRDGVAAMDQAQWQTAIDLLAKVKEPAVLQRDSAEKVKILEKISRAELASSGVSG